MKGFIFLLDEYNMPHFVNISCIVTIKGVNKGKHTELRLSDCSIFIAKTTIEEIDRLIEGSQ